jgi:YD repeat-containing protein
LVCGEWTKLEVEITIPPGFDTSTSELGFSIHHSGTGNAYVDDWRIQPADALVTHSIFNEKRGLLEAQLNNDNQVTEYSYDAFGRVLEVEIETENGMSKIQEVERNIADYD